MTTLPPPDPEAFFAELAAAWTGKNYTETERYKDFRQLFMGSDQGKRVLYQILGWGHMFRSSAALALHDPYRTQFHDGERNLTLRIFNAVHVEPKDKPTRAVSQRPKNERIDHG